MLQSKKGATDYCTEKRKEEDKKDKERLNG